MSQPLYQSIAPLQRLIVTLVIMSATLMQVLDSTIVNVALPHMRGSLGASSDAITWTLTSYLVASAIFMPLTGYFADRLGRKTFLIVAIAGFTLASMLCGMSMTLSQIIFFRFLQGALGAGVAPLSQALLAEIYAPEDRGKAMAIWGVGVMVGPILGPSLGGYLTDVANWRWTFYVNVPIGLCTLMFTHLIPDTPKIKRHMDWLGLLLITLAIASVQYVLDRGNSADWFHATSICVITYIGVSAFLFFILHSVGRTGTKVFDIRIFKDKNFSLACLLLCIFGLGLYGMMVIQPMMMEGLYNYPALTTGLMLAPRGVSSMLSMFMMSKLLRYVDPRILIIIGILLSALGMYAGTSYSLYNISPFWIICPMLLQGFGLGMVFVSLSTIAFATIDANLRTEAAGLFSLIRTIGGSIGISIAITLITRHTQISWHQLVTFIQPYNTSLYHYFNGIHASPTQPMSVAMLGGELYRQAEMLSFINVFAIIMWSFLGMIPLVFFLKKVKTVYNTPQMQAD